MPHEQDEPAPDWITKTPEEPRYFITMYDDDGNLQDIDLDRDEYIALKRHLAKMRGYEVPEETESSG